MNEASAKSAKKNAATASSYIYCHPRVTADSYIYCHPILCKESSFYPELFEINVR